MSSDDDLGLDDAADRLERMELDDDDDDAPPSGVPAAGAPPTTGIAQPSSSPPRGQFDTGPDTSPDLAPVGVPSTPSTPSVAVAPILQPRALRSAFVESPRRVTTAANAPINNPFRERSEPQAATAPASSHSPRETTKNLLERGQRLK